MILVDSHCHLNMDQFKDDLPQVVENARGAGVKYMQTICTKMANFPEILSIAKQYDDIFCSVGVHPNEVEESNIVSVEELVKCSSEKEVVGLGETGLDFYYESAPRDAQIKSFLNHIEASRITGLPVIIHARDADSEIIQILQQEQNKGKFTGLIHCFSSGYELAKAAVDLGMYVSLAGIVTFKNAKDLQESARKLPLNRLLVETDAPYLAPTPHRGKRNEPAYTKHTAEFLSQLKDCSFEEVAKQTTDNFFDLFNKAER